MNDRSTMQWVKRSSLKTSLKVVLYNISFPEPRMMREIDSLVGPSFTMIERLRLRGVGSPKLLIVDASPGILERTEINQDDKQCNVELRTKGVIIRFRALLETYALVIPYPKLTFYQNSELWSFHTDGEYIKAVPQNMGKANRSFLIKLMGEKAKAAGGGPNAG